MKILSRGGRQLLLLNLRKPPRALSIGRCSGLALIKFGLQTGVRSFVNTTNIALASVAVAWMLEVLGSLLLIYFNASNVELVARPEQAIGRYNSCLSGATID